MGRMEQKRAHLQMASNNFHKSLGGLKKDLLSLSCLFQVTLGIGEEVKNK